MHFEFEYGKILVDGREVSQAEIMDILLYQQKKIERLERALEDDDPRIKWHRSNLGFKTRR